jgi:predicted nucleic acid-binding protein
MGLIWHVPKAVADEGLYVCAEADGGRAAKRRIELEPSVHAKVIQLCDVAGTAEASLYVTLARTLDDGEAMGIAIAKVRGWAIATDDRQARMKAAELKVPVVTTPELMRMWAERNSIPALDVARALQRIQTLARFIPNPSFPDYEWWTKVLATGTVK